MHTCKCSAIALALLSIGFSATAAEVNMYGTYSVGAVYQDFRHQNGTNFTMSNGATSLDQSLYGLQGKEDLGNGLYAGFQLEGGFNPDDGTLMASNTIFDRKARLFLGNERFELTFGRFGNFVQAGTPYTIYGKLGVSGISCPGRLLQVGNLARLPIFFMGFRLDLAFVGAEVEGPTRSVGGSSSDPTNAARAGLAHMRRRAACERPKIALL